MDKKWQVTTDRFSQRQRHEIEDMEGRMAAHAAAQATSLEERMAAALTAAMAAQTQQMTALMQSQAAGHGEGGLGLAKGDG